MCQCRMMTGAGGQKGSIQLSCIASSLQFIFAFSDRSKCRIFGCLPSSIQNWLIVWCHSLSDGIVMVTGSGGGSHGDGKTTANGRGGGHLLLAHSSNYCGRFIHHGGTKPIPGTVYIWEYILI